MNEDVKKIIDAEVVANPEKLPDNELVLNEEEAKAKLIKNEKRAQPLILPGNRRQRRKLQKQLKVPKEMIHKFSLKESLQIQAEIKKNTVDFKWPEKIYKKKSEKTETSVI